MSTFPFAHPKAQPAFAEMARVRYLSAKPAATSGSDSIQTGSATTRVLVCDSQPITAAGVRALLASFPEFEVLEEATSLGHCRERVRRDQPSLVILDKALGLQAVLDWIADLKITEARRAAAGEAFVVPAVVVWGVAMTEGEALRFLQAGAKGIIRKTANPKSLIACLRTVASGRNWMEDSVFREAARQERYPRSELTPREQQVMELVEQGMKNREIARELGIRPGTVKIHLKHIFEKTGVRGRYGLALTGMREKGLLSLADSVENAEAGDSIEG